MADVVASMTAENALLVDKRVQQLASKVCGNDPRTKPQRMSDALFCATMGVDFACDCGDERCEFACKDPDDGEDALAQFVVHVVMDQATAEGRESNPGFIDGHGVISGDHAGDIAARRDARIRPLGGGTLARRPAAPREVPNKTLRPSEDAEMTLAERLAAWKRLTNFEEPESKAPATASGSGSSQLGDAVAAEVPAAEADPATTTAPSTTSTTADPAAGSSESDGIGGAGDEPVVVGCEAPPNEPRPNEPPPTSSQMTRTCTTSGSNRVRIRGTGSAAMPTALPSNPYRLSAALNTFVRIRDAYCVFPGCNRPAWRSEIDHTEEYNHDDPDSGGRTTPDDTKCLCKFHHLIKSFGDWIDLQSLDGEGRSRVVFISPEGERFLGPVWTGEDLFPELVDASWAPATRKTIGEMPMRSRTRLASKYVRRQAERERNRRAFDNPESNPPPEADEYDGPPPPF
jgi:hypothetical protein